MRKKFTYKPSNPNVFLEKLVLHSAQESYFTLLYTGGNVSNSSVSNDHDWIVAIGANELIESIDNSYDELISFQNKTKDWLFGYFSYDLKNETESLCSENHDGLAFPTMRFVQPEIVIIKTNKIIECHYLLSADIEAKLAEVEKISSSSKNSSNINFQLKISKEQYIANVNRLLEHIQFGNIYEINYCQEFYTNPDQFNPYSTYLDILTKFPTPFSCFVKQNEHFILSASPERFLTKQGNKLYSQPIKGTIQRGKTPQEDEQLATELFENKKERGENVMIVDLVRNDLAKIAKTGSVKVEELFGIYSYQTVHQMISTVSAELDPCHHPIDAINACFPMGSMTGAPKHRAMQLIEEFEQTKRGIYAGAVGYFHPSGDFDFNVIIRTLLYNSKKNYLSLMVGSAITNLSIPEKEYEECILKASAFFKLLKKAKHNA